MAKQELFIRAISPDGSYEPQKISKDYVLKISVLTGQEFQITAFSNNEEITVTDTLAIS
jgi:hypothetical protein